MRQKLQFPSGQHQLSGLLESPDNPADIRFYAVFAHCFTCGKDIAAASRISRALVAQGVAVLRFDFTGLGNSDGDFANSNFSSNIQDLLAAVDYLRHDYQAPRLLIGHSLGGAAVLGVAPHVPECQAVATIGAPAEAAHVVHNFAVHLDEIEQEGEATVKLGTREFQIKKQFLDDLDQYSTAHIGEMKKALLVLHAPMDSTVSIKEAEKIYGAAKHPKSFVSLDDADHLLSQRRDAEYAAQVIAAWASRYVGEPTRSDKPAITQGHVLVEEKDHVFSQHVSTASHYWLADEPKKVGGSNLGPDPYEHLLAGLGACTSMTLRMYATRKQLPLKHVKVELTHKRDYQVDCEECEGGSQGIEAIIRHIHLDGDLSAEQRQRLLEIADKCPVHKTLHNHVTVVSKLVDE